MILKHSSALCWLVVEKMTRHAFDLVQFVFGPYL
jgi:hypothetical protein